MTVRHVFYTQEPGVDGNGITSIEKLQLQSDVNFAYTETAVIAALRFDPFHPNYGAIAGTGLSPAQRIANAAAIQLAADDARDAGGTLVIKGTFEFTGVLTFRCHVDGSSGTLNAYGSGSSVVVGSKVAGDFVFEKIAVLPELINMDKIALGWDGTSVGYELANIHSWQVTLRHVKNFTTNVWMSAYSTGCVYNTIYVSWLDNGKRNLRLASGNTGGWVNENTIIGGRYFMELAEGSNVSGARHILLEKTGTWNVDNNRFIGPSIEGNTPEYHVELIGANQNRFMQARWEAQPPKIRFESSPDNVIDYGYRPAAHPIQATYATSSPRNVILDTRYQRIGSSGDLGGLILDNSTSDDSAVMTVMRPSSAFTGTVPATDYTVQVTASTTKYKAEASVHPHVQINHISGEIFVGNGAAAPTAGIRAYGQTGLRFAGQFHGFYGATPVTKPTVSGSRGGNAALTSLLNALADLGLITNSTS